MYLIRSLQKKSIFMPCAGEITGFLPSIRSWVFTRAAYATMPNHSRRLIAIKRGFTIVELLVVTSISILLMLVLSFIYSNVLKVYRESQGIQEMYETARIFNRDLRDTLSHVVAIRGAWINPICNRFPGVPNAVQPTTTHTPNTIDYYYLDSGVCASGANENVTVKSAAMTQQLYYYCESLFSMPHWPVSPNRDGSIGYRRGTSNDITGRADNNVGNVGNLYPGVKGWWLPGFYGQRDGASRPQYNYTYTVLEFSNNIAGAWGWPRPDYRLDVDMDDPQHQNVIACWFYSENRKFHSPRTMALDNSNIVLTSIKFSLKTRQFLDDATSVPIPEETQLSVLRHQIVGFDTATSNTVREDYSLGNMLRAITITPYYLNGNVLTRMGDAELGCTQRGAPVAGGQVVPRCFDIKYTLRNRVNFQRYQFALRVYCQINQQ